MSERADFLKVPALGIQRDGILFAQSLKLEGSARRARMLAGAPVFMRRTFASVSEFKEVIVLKRMMWLNLLLGLWLMLSPFVLAFLNQAVFKVLWEDLILGFGIATFSLCRLLSRRSEEIAIADWIVTALGFLTFVNPFLYSYYNVTVAVWNNVIIGSVVFLLAAYQDWKDSDARL
jgi:SPW repeat